MQTTTRKGNGKKEKRIAEFENVHAQLAPGPKIENARARVMLHAHAHDEHFCLTGWLKYAFSASKVISMYLPL